MDTTAIINAIMVFPSAGIDFVVLQVPKCLQPALEKTVAVLMLLVG